MISVCIFGREGREVEGKGRDLQSIVGHVGLGGIFGAILRIFWMYRRIRSTIPTVTVNINIDKSETSHIIPLVEACTLQPKN
jgi:hypothetical protein